MKKIHLLGAVGALTLVLGAGASEGLASSYEWITGFTASTAYPAGSTEGAYYAVSGEEVKVYRTVNTSAAYGEYRSVYYQVTSTTGYVGGANPYIPPSDPYWQEFTECRVYGVVNGSVLDKCFPLAPTGTYPNLLHVLVTTNYAGCGGYTANPGANCGDTTSTYRWYQP